MILLILISICSAIDLHIPESYVIEFDPDCHEFFVLAGAEDYAYFYRNDIHFELWITRNQSYEIYSTSVKDNLTFSWPAKFINNLPMELVLFEGKISQPYQFDTTQILCKTFGYAEGTLVPIITKSEPIYKCNDPPAQNLKYAVVILSIVLVGSMLINADESVRTLLRSEVPRIIQWGATILSGREDRQSERHQETSV